MGLSNELNIWRYLNLTSQTVLASLIQTYKHVAQSYRDRHLIEQVLLRLASIFFVKIVTFCVMFNHHLEMHVDRDLFNKSSPKEITLLTMPVRIGFA